MELIHHSKAFILAAWLATLALIFITLRLRLRLRHRQILKLTIGPKIVANHWKPQPHRSFPFVVGSSAEMAKAFLKTYDVVFAYRPKMAAGKYTARKICSMELFSVKRLKSYEYIRVEELTLLLMYLYESSGKPVTLKDHLADVSLNVISCMVLGEKYINKHDNGIKTRQEFKEMVDEFVALNGVFDGNIRRMKAVAEKFDSFLEHMIDEHDARRKLADDPTLKVKFERHGVKGFILDLIAGAIETSTIMLEWAFTELLKNPEIYNKATKELDRVIGNERWVEEEDIINLPFIDAMVKETLRLHGAPMLMPRMAREDCKVAGYDVRKGTQILASTWSIMRDHEAGIKMCPGNCLGLKVIQSSLELNMDGVFKLLNHKKIPLEAVVQPRLPPYLYNM
ncbi:cytochrome P450 84A1 [Citrus sinensis]|nr:cytochrome P450 84A1 [Citrus sinensis]